MSPASRTQTIELRKPEGCRFEGPGGSYDVYPRNSPECPFIVVDVSLEPGTEGRVVAECGSLEGAKKEAERLSKFGGRA